MANTRQVAKTSGSDIVALVNSKEMRAQFAKALPRHLTPDRFIRVVTTILNRNPKLKKCTQSSLMACLLDCSQLGIEPDGRKAHLIPYGDQCTLIIDYKGLADLARRSGEIADLHADVVGENDTFEYSYGVGGSLMHKPNLKDRGKIIAAYSFVKLKDGSVSYEVMGVDEVNSIKKRSKAGNAGPWVTDWSEMAKKTVFRRHCKWLPSATDVLAAIEKDHDRFQDDVIDIHVKPETTAPTSTEDKPVAPPAVDEAPPAPRTTLQRIKDMRDIIGTKEYGKILGAAGYLEDEEIPEKAQAAILKQMLASAAIIKGEDS